MRALMVILALSLTLACITSPPAETPSPITSTPLPTYTPFHTQTPLPTYTPFATWTPAPTELVAAATATTEPTATIAPMPEPTATATPEPQPTETPTAEPTAMVTPTLTPEPTATPTQTPQHVTVGEKQEYFEGAAYTAVTLGIEQFQQGDYSGAISSLEDAIGHHKTPSAVIQIYLGLSFNALRQYGLAIEHFTKALAVEDNSLARFNRSKAYMDNGQCDHAVSDATVALSLNPVRQPGFHTSVESNTVLAVCYYAYEDYSLALEHIDAALRLARGSSYSDDQIASVEEFRATIMSDSDVARATPAPEPTATATLTPTPEPKGLQPAVCNPSPCNEATPPAISLVDWVESPRVTADGKFTLIARVHVGHDLIIANPAPPVGRLNVNFSNDGVLYGSILPADNTPGWKWKEKPTTWEADVYDYEDRVLTVVAQIPPAAATHPGFRMCLWRGGATREDTYILGCTEVTQP